MNAVDYFNKISEREKNLEVKHTRYYIPKEYFIFDSTLFVELLEKHTRGGLTENEKKFLYAILRLHYFNVGKLDNSDRADNLTKRTKRGLNIGSLRPGALMKTGIDPNYFSGEDDPLKIFDRLLKDKNREIDSQKFSIDDVLYEDRPHIDISKQGWRRYTLDKLNKTNDIARTKKLKNIDEIKKQLIDKEIFKDEEYKTLVKIKKELYQLLKITKGIFNRDKVDTSNISTSELDRIIEALYQTFLLMMKGLRKGMKKEFVNAMLSAIKEAKKSDVLKKINLLFDVTDRINLEKELYTVLAQGCEREYDISLGKFCRRILPLLIEQENLSRGEIRFFILINLSLRIFNRHLAQKELMISNFIQIPKFEEALFRVIINRNRKKNNISEVEKMFKSYLSIMKSIVELLRSYDTDKKYRLRGKAKFIEYHDDDPDGTKTKSKSPETVDETQIEADSLNEAISKEVQPPKGKSDVENDYTSESIDSDDVDSSEDRPEGEENLDFVDGDVSEGQSEDEEDILSSENINNWDRASKQIPIIQNQSDPIKAREKLRRQFRGVEMRDYLDSVKFNEEEKKFFNYLLEGLSQAEIAKELDITQQAVGKRIQRIKRKLGFKRSLLFRRS